MMSLYILATLEGILQKIQAFDQSLRKTSPTETELAP